MSAAVHSVPGGPRAAFDVVAVVASRGSLHAFRTLLGSLPATFPASLILVQHMADAAPRLLVNLLHPVSTLGVRWADDGVAPQPGTAYVAPPAYDLRFEHGVFQLSAGPRLQYVRPSADLLLASIARNVGRRAVAVVLRGSGDDGAIGARILRNRGGVVIAEDPLTVPYNDMPRAALRAGAVHFVLRLEQIALGLETLVARPGVADHLFGPRAA